MQITQQQNTHEAVVGKLQEQIDALNTGVSEKQKQIDERQTSLDKVYTTMNEAVTERDRLLETESIEISRLKQELTDKHNKIDELANEKQKLTFLEGKHLTIRQIS